MHRLTTSRSLQLVLFGAAGLLALVSVLSVDTASNSVPPTRLGQDTRAIGPNDLKPAACAGIVVTNMMIGTGSAILNGTSAANLLIGVPGTVTINARQGNDCVVGNSSVTAISGGTGTDVCIGGASTVFALCETVIRQ